MTTTKPHDETDRAIAAIAALTQHPQEQFHYERSNLLRNMLHIRHMPTQQLFIYSTGSGNIYPPLVKS